MSAQSLLASPVVLFVAAGVAVLLFPGVTAEAAAAEDDAAAVAGRRLTENRDEEEDFVWHDSAPGL